MIAAPAQYSQADPLRTGAGETAAHQANGPGAAPSTTWWLAFGSPALDAIIELALNGCTPRQC